MKLLICTFLGIIVVALSAPIYKLDDIDASQDVLISDENESQQELGMAVPGDEEITDFVQAANHGNEHHSIDYGDQIDVGAADFQETESASESADTAEFPKDESEPLVDEDASDDEAASEPADDAGDASEPAEDAKISRVGIPLVHRVPVNLPKPGNRLMTAKEAYNQNIWNIWRMQLNLRLNDAEKMSESTGLTDGIKIQNDAFDDTTIDAVRRATDDAAVYCNGC